MWPAACFYKKCFIGTQHVPITYGHLGIPMVELNGYDRDPQTHRVYHLALNAKVCQFFLQVVRRKRFFGSDICWLKWSQTGFFNEGFEMFTVLMGTVNL